MIIDFASFWQNTNNMKKATLYVLITITMLAILESCHQSYKKKLMLMSYIKVMLLVLLMEGCILPQDLHPYGNNYVIKRRI